MRITRSGAESETDFLEYLTERGSDVSTTATFDDLQIAAVKLEREREASQRHASVIAAFSVIPLLIAAGVYITGNGLSAVEWIIVCALFAFGTASLVLARYLYQNDVHIIWHGIRQAKFERQADMAALLEEVNDGDDRIFRLSDTGQLLTPVTRQPSDLVIGKGALANPLLPKLLFHPDSATSRFVVVRRGPEGLWPDFYLWNPPIAEMLGELWDQTPSRYVDYAHPELGVEHRKIRVALISIASSVLRDRGRSNRHASAEKNLRLNLESSLKLEANRLAHNSAWTEVELAELSQIGLKNDRKNELQVPFGGMVVRLQKANSDSWLQRMRIGKYPAICEPLADTIRDKLKIEPGFIIR